MVVYIREEGWDERGKMGHDSQTELLIKSNEEWCVSRAGEAKGDQRQDSGPSLNKRQQAYSAQH